MVLSKKTSTYLILTLLISCLTITPLFNKGFFPMHDNTQPTRIYEMAGALRDGQFPVRWVADLGYGYGYPIFNFYAPLPYYFGALGVILGLDLLVATKVMFAMGILLSGISMFFLGRELWGEEVGIVSSLIYIFAPYHAVEVYVRGAVGEYWAYGILPIVFLGMVLTQKPTSRKLGVIVGSLGFVGVILSHNIIAMIVLGIVFIWELIEIVKALFTKNWSVVTSFFFMGMIGLGISAFFWMPALVEARYTKVENLVLGTNDFHNHFVYIDQLWDSPWGFAGSAPGRSDGMSFRLGKLQTIFSAVMILSFVFFLSHKKINKINHLPFFVSTLGLVFSVFLLLPESVAVWERIGFLKYVQYPWRFLVFANFFITLTCGGGIYLYKEKIKLPIVLWFVMIVGVTLLLYFNIKYFKPQYITNQIAQDYINSEAVRWNISKISDEYLPKYFPIPQNISQTKYEKIGVTDDIIVEESQIKSQLINLKVSVKNKAEIVFSIAYFPGWKVVADGQEVKPLIKDGKVVVPVEVGKHIITLFFSDTPVRIFANIISCIAVIFFIIITIRKSELYSL